MRVFENRALRRIFGPKKDEVTGKLRKRLTKYFSGDQSKNNEIGQDMQHV